MHMIGIIICVPLYITAVLLFGASLTAGIFVFHVAVVPLIFKYSKSFRRNLVFANFVQWPPKVDFDDPSASGIEGARNLSIEYHSKVDNCRIKIGIWHILPREVYERRREEIQNITDKEELNRLMDEELAKADKPVMMYCHGNSNSRAAYHRIRLYQFFQDLDFHTIAFDYRGYGDSTAIRPTEPGVVEDSLIVYEWTLSKGVDICVWGHSLGTGISSHLLGNLSELSARLLTRDPLRKPVALVLESPFNNMADEVAHHPLSKLVTWLPYYDASFVEPFRSSDHHFTSDRHMSREKDIPVLILHAKDDVIVPFVVGNKLYKSLVSSRADGGALVRLRAYDGALDLGHKWICNAPDLDTVLKEFLSNLKTQ